MTSYRIPLKQKNAVVAARRFKLKIFCLTSTFPRSDLTFETSLMENHLSWEQDFLEREREILEQLPQVSELPELST